MNAEAARNLVVQGGRWKQSVIETVGHRDRHCIQIGDFAPSGPLKVTLVWDDAPAAGNIAAQTSPKLINDLELRLVPPTTGAPEVEPWTVEPPPVVEDPTGIHEVSPRSSKCSIDR